jgi:ABC-2 type transport system ATP-binding protein
MVLAIALVHQPRLIFLDEPTSGVDPTARRDFWDLIYKLADQGVTVFVTTHYMDEAEYCGRVGMMRDGRLLALDTPAALKMRFIPGNVWDVYGELKQMALRTYEACEGVLRVGLAGDHLRVITRRGMTEDTLGRELKSSGLMVISLEPSNPTLEDVFLTLAKGSIKE